MFQEFTKENLGLMIIAIILVFVVLANSKKRKAIVYKKKKTSQYNEDEEYVLDLLFNNNETMGVTLSLYVVVSFVVSAVIGIALTLFVFFLSYNEILFTTSFLDTEVPQIYWTN